AGVDRCGAGCLRELGSTGDALGALDRHLAVRPRDAGAYRERGLLKEKRGDVRGAINDYTSALVLRPDAATLVRRGWARLGSGDPRLARADFEEARRLDGKNAEALLGHGYASLKLGHRRQAEADVEKADPLKLKDTQALYNAARFCMELAAALEFEAGQAPRRTEYQVKACQLLGKALSSLKE